MKLKSLVGVISVLLMMLTFAACGNSASGDPTTPQGGENGLSEATAFLVNNEVSLRRVGTETGYGTWNLDAYYKQTADIALSYEWIPIGVGHTPGVVTSGADSFRGHYDGGGYTISGLRINYASGVDAGLFGQMVGGSTVKNVRLNNVNITGTGNTSACHVGAIAGSILNNCIVQNCYVSGSINYGASNYDNPLQSFSVGGIAGDSYSMIENCYSAVNVSKSNNQVAWFHCGGIAGSNSGTVRNCYSTGNVSITEIYGGGIVGYNFGTVEYCYAKGNISCFANSGYIGGITGYNFNTAANNATVWHCTALNSAVTKTGSNPSGAGRVIGYMYSPITLSNNYANSAMTVNGSAVLDASLTPTNDINGQGITSTDWNSASFWSDTVGFSSTAWSLANGRLPKLAWE